MRKFQTDFHIDLTIPKAVVVVFLTALLICLVAAVCTVLIRHYFKCRAAKKAIVKEIYQQICYVLFAEHKHGSYIWLAEYVKFYEPKMFEVVVKQLVRDGILEVCDELEQYSSRQLSYDTGANKLFCYNQIAWYKKEEFETPDDIFHPVV